MIELLVVISIIATLISILVPSLSQAKLLAKRSACASNLKNIGVAAQYYQNEYGEYVPVYYRNVAGEGTFKSWRTYLLVYLKDYRYFNCPAAYDNGTIGQVYHSNEEIISTEPVTVNSGSYGVMMQYALKSEKTGNRESPQSVLALSTTPGIDWADPFNSVYLADSYIIPTGVASVTYPSQANPKSGTTYINLPNVPSSYTESGWPLGATAKTRYFSDRHVGTNCLFLGGHVQNYATWVLDNMQAEKPDCVWDVH